MYDLNSSVFGDYKIDSLDDEPVKKEEPKTEEKKPVRKTTTRKKRTTTKKITTPKTTPKTTEKVSITETPFEKPIEKQVETKQEETIKTETSVDWLVGKKVFVLGEGSKPYKCQKIEDGIAHVYSITEGINKKVKSELISHKPNYNRIY